MSVLVVAAHPDDETLGCGGTIAKFTKAGMPVDVVIVTRTGPYLERYSGIEGDLDERRQQEAHAACEELGVRNLYFGDFEETHLAARPFPSLVEFLREMIGYFGPSEILTHSEHDLHQDHRAVAEATWIAARPYDRRTVQRVLAYSTDPLHLHGSPRRNVYVDVSGPPMYSKYAALKRYRSEVRLAPHPRSYAAVASLAQAVGVVAGVTAAEAFDLVWEVR